MKKLFSILFTILIASTISILDVSAQTLNVVEATGSGVSNIPRSNYTSDGLLLPDEIPSGVDRMPCPITAIGIQMTNVSTCAGTPCDGSVTVTSVTGGTGTNTYLWSNGQTGPTATGLCPGSMNVQVTSGTCSYTYTFPMLKGKQRPAPARDSLWFNMWTQYTHSSGSPPTSFWICDGECVVLWVGDRFNSGPSGVGVINYSDGGPPYTFTWSSNVPGATNSPGKFTSCYPPNPLNTTYTLSVSDAACITATIAVTPQVRPQPLLLTSGAVDASCFGVCDGSVTVNASGATAPYTYLWNNGATTPTTNALCAGTYSVTVTDTYQCRATVNGTVLGGVQIIPGITKTDVSCAGGTDGTATASASGGAPGFTYSWNTAPVQNTATATNIGAGTYIVTITDTKNCTATASVTITEPTPVAVTTSTTPAGCGASNGSATASPSGGTAPYTYSWNSTPAQNTVTANGLSGGSYIVTVTDSRGCTRTASAIVNSSGPPSVTAVNTPVSCNGGSNGTATASGSGGSGPYVYTWNSVPAQTGATATGLPAGSYDVVLTDAFGCTSTTTTIITEPTLLVLNTSSTNQICGASNGSATVTATGGTPGYTYSWNSSPAQNTATASNLPTGTFVVTVTDGNGCTQTASATVTSTGAATIVINSSSNPLCSGSSDGTITASATAGTAPFTYSWNTSPVQNTATATSLPAGTYIVTLTDVNGCTSTASATLTQPTPVVVTSPNVSICPGTSATLTANGSGGTGTISYGWNPGGLTGNPITVTPATTTPYTITATDANGCVGTQLVTVTINPPATISVPAASICSGLSTTLTASGANSYSWLPITGLSSGTGSLVTANPTITTTYTVTGTNASGCTGSTTVVVTVNTAPVISSSPSSICPGDTTTIIASGADTYTWSPTSGLSPTTGNTVTANPISTTVYTITGIGTNGCIGTSNVTITVHPLPVAGFIYNPNPGSELEPTIYFTDQSTPSVSWYWTFGDTANTTSNSQHPSFTYPKADGTYTACLAITSQFGCVDTICNIVRIQGEYTFFIPNTFTPNGDGKNDGFTPKGTGIDESAYELWIFDRWGNFIWKTNIWGEQWDGRANGGENVAQIDTYVWKVFVREKYSGRRHKYIGHVNIVK